MQTLLSPAFLKPSFAPLSWQTYLPADTDEALARWRQLEWRIHDRSVASSAAWTQCWLDVYGEVVPHRILIAQADGIDRGAVLLASSRAEKIGPVRIRSLHVGTAGEPQPGSVCVEYNRLLVEPLYREAFIAGLSESIHRDRHWEQFRLDGFAGEDLAGWLPFFPQAQIRSRDSRYFDLKFSRESGQDILSLLGRSTRSNLRRRLKQYGELQCEWAENVEQAADILNELMLLHQARWQSIGQPGAFASDRFQRFQMAACVQLFLEQRVVLFRVRHQGETVGALMLLVDRNRLLDYLSGLADFHLQPSPGLVSHYLCMEAARQRGFDAYDFLVGEKQHKNNLSTHVGQICWLTWSRPTWKMKALDHLRAIKQRLAGRGSPAADPQETSVDD
jgi:CelD/BcsL family acetyltransferase involved in cellulose biosynthesis